MTWWLFGALANATVGVAYLCIATIILQGLRVTGQLRSNPLAVATGAIFFSCGIGHGLHGFHLLFPMQDMVGMGEGGMRAVWSPDVALWDAGTACVAITYLAMRRRFGQLMRTPDMFRDEVDRAASRELGEVLDQLPEGVIVLSEVGEAEQLNAAGRALVGELGLDPDRLGASLHEQVPQLQRTRDTGGGRRIGAVARREGRRRCPGPARVRPGATPGRGAAAPPCGLAHRRHPGA